MNRDWEWLKQQFAAISRLEHAFALMEWDQATLLASGGQRARGEAMAELQLVINQRLQSPKLEDALSRAETALSLEQKRMAQLMRRKIEEAAVLEDDFVRRRIELSVACESAWRTARVEGDFTRFERAFAPCLARLKEEAQIRRTDQSQSLYQALLNKFEPDLSVAKLDELFAPLKAQLPDLIRQASEHSAGRSRQPLPHVDAAKQQKLAQLLLKPLGFNTERGRLDISSHPFTAGVASDVRITSRYDETNPLSGLYSLIHELGHGCFEQGIAHRWYNTPMVKVQSAALHESQALTFEMQLAREADFIEWLSENCQFHWGENSALSAENLLAHVTEVKPSLIRVEADEVTYPAHILLRYELETAMLSGDLPLSELPSAWNEGMQKWLGIQPESPAQGCLQDIHWCFGEFGYFPSYTLGAMFAAQLTEQWKAQPQWQQSPMERHQWVSEQLAQKLWSTGGQYDLLSGCQALTGTPLSAQSLLSHLKRRYL